jgi:hypothetical protein
MESLLKIETSAMSLTEADRAVLASHLLESLPAILHESDDGLAEAMRRDSELDADPSLGMTLDELNSAMGRE